VGENMGKEAAGAYLQRLREYLNLSRSKIAERLDTNDMQISRVEKGEVDTRVSFMLSIVQLLNGDVTEVTDLLLNDHATIEDGQLIADRRILKKGIKEDRVLYTVMDSNFHIYEILEILLRLKDHPEQQQMLLEYARGLYFSLNK
jgi:transcriptional regulator with XRE-family HTH domain